MDLDFAELQLFVRTRDDAAFRRVIARYGDLVYGACLRQTRDPGLADDAAQAVFIVLAKKAESIRRGTALAGWLYNVARYASRNVLRSERRRRKHERNAAVRVDATTPGDAASEIGEVLDAALARLGRRDREAIVMRYFQGKSHQEIGEASGAGAQAAKMRVLRAVQRLRAALAREGVTAMPEVVEAGLVAAAACRAPVGFVEAATKAASGAAAGAGAGIAAAVVTGMVMRKAAVVAIVVGGIMTIAGVTLAVSRAPIVPVAKTRATTAATSRAASEQHWRTQFDAVYRLDQGEAIRRVQPPYVAARKEFYLDWYAQHGPITGLGNGVVGSGQAANTPTPPVAMFFLFDSDSGRVERAIRFNADPWRVGTLLFALVGLDLHEYTAPSGLIQTVLPGDWVVRSDASVEAKLAGFQKVTADTPAAFKYHQEKLKREVIAVRGKFDRERFKNGVIRLSIAEEGQEPGKLAGGDVGYFVREWSRILHRPVIVSEWEVPRDVRIEFDLTGQKLWTLPKEEQQARVKALVQRMAEQMGASMELETREIETCLIEPTPAGKK